MRFVGRYAPGAGSARPPLDLCSRYSIKMIAMFSFIHDLYCVIVCIGEPDVKTYREMSRILIYRFS